MFGKYNMLSYTEIINKISAKIKELRLKQNITRKDMAASSGVSVPSIARMEDGEIKSFIPDGTYVIKQGDIPNVATKVIIPYGVTSIEECSFESSCVSTVEIPNSVTSISPWAFCNCNRLSSLVVPQSVTHIGKGAFSCCWSLKTIILPENLTRINDSAFFNCNLLASIEIPRHVKSIGNEAFAHCFSILSVKIPTGVESLGNCIFYCCRNLTSIELPNSLKSIGSAAFFECCSLVNIKLHFENPNDVPQGFKDNTLNPSKITLEVPNGAVYSYQIHPYFSKFKKIIAIQQ